jgi:hypothetical protein
MSILRIWFVVMMLCVHTLWGLEKRYKVEVPDLEDPKVQSQTDCSACLVMTRLLLETLPEQLVLMRKARAAPHLKLGDSTALPFFEAACKDVNEKYHPATVHGIRQFVKGPGVRDTLTMDRIKDVCTVVIEDGDEQILRHVNEADGKPVQDVIPKSKCICSKSLGLCKRAFNPDQMCASLSKENL